MTPRLLIAPPFAYGIPAGPYPCACAHMAYPPRSAMALAADLNHDLQDMLRRWLFGETADWVRHDPPDLPCCGWQSSPQGQLVELELMPHLVNRYPLQFPPN